MTRFALPLLLPALLCSPGAFAEERKPQVKDLPGVEVEPPMQEPTLQPGESIRIGNWDVRISGSISYEIGTSVKLK